MQYDQNSYILGMITAFCECVAGGCKRMALSPPLTCKAFFDVREEAYQCIERHGLIHYHEKNADLPEAERFHWIVIAARQETLDEYQRLRAEGYNPAKWMKPFYELLSYNEAESVRTGYDAYRALFDKKEEENP
ncbi:MAG: hypothetical protein IJU12_03815 [Clostridia bacterium]|nr:hypothetical protein [Clostridia bacterium]